MKAALTFMRQRVPERHGDGGVPADGGKQGQQSQPESLKTEQARSVLHRFFGHAQFRGQQERAVLAAFSSRDCFVLMPTGRLFLHQILRLDASWGKRIGSKGLLVWQIICKLFLFQRELGHPETGRSGYL